MYQSRTEKRMLASSERGRGFTGQIFRSIPMIAAFPIYTSIATGWAWRLHSILDTKVLWIKTTV